MYIGNIITNSIVDDKNFKVCHEMDTIDETLPTLIVGWDNVKQIMGENVSILHKEISEKISWTFSPKERKSEYDSDLQNFKKKCYSSFGNNIPYVYLDLILGKKHINYRIIRKILSLKKPFIYFSKTNMVYIYGDNILFGVDLNFISLFDNKKEKIIKKIKNLENNILVDLEIFNKCEDFILNNKNKEKYIPYIYKHEYDR